jgi:hypothetical protein
MRLADRRPSARERLAHVQWHVKTDFAILLICMHAFLATFLATIVPGVEGGDGAPV